MKKIISILFITVLITACGGGDGDTQPLAPPNVTPGVAPTGSFAGQVDPVKATD